jgi:hypothetical protein
MSSHEAQRADIVGLSVMAEEAVEKVIFNSPLSCAFAEMY